MHSDIGIHKRMCIVGLHFGTTASRLGKIDEFLGILRRDDLVSPPRNQRKQREHQSQKAHKGSSSQNNVRDKTTLPLVRSGVALYLSLFDRPVLGRDTVESVLSFWAQGGKPRA